MKKPIPPTGRPVLPPGLLAKITTSAAVKQTTNTGNSPRAFYLSPINGRGEVIVRSGGQVQQNSLPVALPSGLLSFLSSPDEQDNLLKTDKDKQIQSSKLNSGRSYSVFYSVPIRELKSIIDSSGKGVPVESLGYLSGPANILIGSEAFKRIKNMGHLSGSYEPVLLPAYGPASYATKKREYLTGESIAVAAVLVGLAIAVLILFVYMSRRRTRSRIVPDPR